MGSLNTQSNEELINQAAGFSCGCDKCLARVEPPRTELLSRLERGRKAIEAMENIRGWMRDDAIYLSNLYDIIHKYQQSCKEDTDGN